jgi:hypothetical protein
MISEFFVAHPHTCSPYPRLRAYPPSSANLTSACAMVNGVCVARPLALASFSLSASHALTVAAPPIRPSPRALHMRIK